MDLYRQKYGLILISLVVCVMILENWFLNFAAAEPIQLIASGNVEIEKDQILLGDLVRIQGAKIEIKKQIEPIEMGVAPPLGRDRNIDEKDIRLRLKRANVDTKQIEFMIPQPIVVRRASMDVAPAMIEKAVKNFINSKIALKNAVISIKKIRWSGQIKIPRGKLTYDIKHRHKTDFIGNVTLSVFLYVNGCLKKRLPVSAKVEIVIPVAFVRKPLSRGQVIKASDLGLRTAELSKIRGNPIKNLDFVIGKRVRHQIYPQQPLLEKDIEIPPTLKRGDSVKIVVASSNLIATVRGMVRENGNVGEKIKVVNIDSKKTLYATVIDQDTVKIDY